MKITQKIFLNTSFLIVGIFLIAIGLNSFFMENYYLHVKKNHLKKIREITLKKDLTKVMEVKNIEDNYDVVIIKIPVENSINSLNENIKTNFSQKKMSLNKFWINKETLEKLKKESYINNLYNQGLIKSSLLVSFYIKNNNLIIIAMAIPHLEESLNIINKFSFLLMGITLLLLLVLLWITLKNVLKPLEKLTMFTNELGKLNFKQVQIKTGDEIEILANHINSMSNDLRKAYADLNKKNEGLKEFMGNITHEIKTPLSLIKAYSIGIKDGVDDGSFLDTINTQADYMSSLLDRLLEYIKLEKVELNREEFSLKKMILELNREFYIEYKNIELDMGEIAECDIFADKEKIKIVLVNLISNALKYNSKGKIQMSLRVEKDKTVFSIKNETDVVYENLEKLWEPFYVGEKSRNKKTSGTGLGLSIVKTILDLHGYKFAIKQESNTFIFYIEFI